MSTLSDVTKMFDVDLLSPDGNHLYDDIDLVGENRWIERLAAEKTAENFPNYFLESNYLTSSFPELVDSAELSLSNEAYKGVSGHDDAVLDGDL